MRLRAMAKINLGLDILGKRDDGYHEVRMLMQTIQMYDLLDIRRKSSPGITLTTNLLYVPSVFLRASVPPSESLYAVC